MFYRAKCAPVNVFGKFYFENYLFILSPDTISFAHAAAFTKLNISVFGIYLPRSWPSSLFYLYACFHSIWMKLFFHENVLNSSASSMNFLCSMIFFTSFHFNSQKRYLSNFLRTVNYVHSNRNTAENCNLHCKRKWLPQEFSKPLYYTLEVYEEQKSCCILWDVSSCLQHEVGFHISQKWHCGILYRQKALFVNSIHQPYELSPQYGRLSKSCLVN